MSKEERKKIEEENIKILNSIINKKSHFVSLDNKNKLIQYSFLLRDLENNLKSFPKEDQNKKYYRQYLDEIIKLNDDIAQIYFLEKNYEKVVEIDKKIIKQNEFNYRSYERLYKAYWELGDKELSVIYGSFLIYKCDKNIRNKYYKDLIPEIEKNIKIVGNEFKNKTWLSEIKLKINKKNIFRCVLFIISMIYLFYNYKDLNIFKY